MTQITLFQSVSLQRRLAENKEIAKVKQQKLLRTKMERREKLRQEAIR